MQIGCLQLEVPRLRCAAAFDEDAVQSVVYRAVQKKYACFKCTVFGSPPQRELVKVLRIFAHVIVFLPQKSNLQIIPRCDQKQ
jgi:hypothetical protein